VTAPRRRCIVLVLYITTTLSSCQPPTAREWVD
jgi:hypothetical protein